MAVKIRLRRVGAKKQPSYRLVAADEQAPRDGRFLEILGHYNPLTDPATVVVKEDRILFWLSKGARPTDGANRALARTTVMQQFNALAKGDAGTTEQAEGTEGQK